MNWKEIMRLCLDIWPARAGPCLGQDSFCWKCAALLQTFQLTNEIVISTKTSYTDPIGCGGLETKQGAKGAKNYSLYMCLFETASRQNDVVKCLFWCTFFAWCQIVCFSLLVPDCQFSYLGVKLSDFTILMPNCPGVKFCKIVLTLIGGNKYDTMWISCWCRREKRQ